MMFDYIQILNYSFLGNSLKAYLIALAVFVLTIIVLKIFKHIVIKKIKKLADHTKAEFDSLIINIIDSTGWLFYLFLSLYLALQFIQLPKAAEKSISYIVFIIVVYYAVKAIQRIIDYIFRKAIQKTRMQEGEKKLLDSSVVDLLRTTIKVILWAVAIILILQNFGYNASALMAGLGIGGLAIAFALQNILGDIFASFSIFFDKPFKIGDFVIIGKDMGTVKKIGIKSTRIQTLQGEEMVVSNRELTNIRIRNYKKMEKRRIVFNIGVTYDTSAEKLRKILEIVKMAVEKTKAGEFDRTHFNKFGDFSLNFEVVYYLNSSDYNVYMDTQQEINFSIREAFEKEGIEFAYPTQTIFVSKAQ